MIITTEKLTKKKTLMLIDKDGKTVRTANVMYAPEIQRIKDEWKSLIR